MRPREIYKAWVDLKTWKGIVTSQDGVTKDNLFQVSDATNKQNLAPPVMFKLLPIYLESMGNEKDRAIRNPALRDSRLHHFSGWPDLSFLVWMSPWHLNRTDEGKHALARCRYSEWDLKATTEAQTTLGFITL